MNKTELKTTLSLAGIFFTRLLGVFIILPVFALYAHSLIGATPFLIGLTLGIYGLTQALLQIPLGTLSDYIGRKPVILAGLVLFLLGSLIAAYSDHIYYILIGRALQGAGAIGSAISALLADSTREQVRTQAMAILGLAVGVAFALAMLISPILAPIIGLSGLFGLTAILAGLAMLALLFVPTPQQIQPVYKHGFLAALGSVLINKQLLRLDAGIFILHAILTAIFMVIPHVVIEQSNLTAASIWRFYIPTLLLAFISALPLIMLIDKKQGIKSALLGSIALLALALFGLWLTYTHIIYFAISLWLFFVAFTLLESLIPSLVSRLAPPALRGSAMGVYSTAQFSGIFVGGMIGGSMYAANMYTELFLLGAIFVMLWLLFAKTMQVPMLPNRADKQE